jgi:myosin-crossreactive antigen
MIYCNRDHSEDKDGLACLVQSCTLKIRDTNMEGNEAPVRLTSMAASNMSSDSVNISGAEGFLSPNGKREEETRFCFKTLHL